MKLAWCVIQYTDTGVIHVHSPRFSSKLHSSIILSPCSWNVMMIRATKMWQKRRENHKVYDIENGHLHSVSSAWAVVFLSHIHRVLENSVESIMNTIQWIQQKIKVIFCHLFTANMDWIWCLFSQNMAVFSFNKPMDISGVLRSGKSS